MLPTSISRFSESALLNSTKCIEINKAKYLITKQQKKFIDEERELPAVVYKSRLRKAASYCLKSLHQAYKLKLRFSFF